MVERSIEDRAGTLEHTIQALPPLPTEVKVLRDEFYGCRRELRELKDDVRNVQSELRDFQALVVTSFTRLEQTVRGGDEESRRLAREGDEETRRLMRAGEEETRRLIRETDEETRRLIREGDDETRRQMREGDEETRQLVLALHREVMARFDALERR